MTVYFLIMERIC